VVAELICIPIWELPDIIAKHKGYPLSQSKTSYLASARTFVVSAADLLACIDRFESFASEKGAFERIARGRFETIEHAMQKEVFAFVNAAHSLVDHSRSIKKKFGIGDYDASWAQCFGVDGLHEFVVDFRNLVHHASFVASEWEVSGTFGEVGGITATFHLYRAELLRLGALDRRSLSAQARRFLDNGPEKIDLRRLVKEYAERAGKFSDWLSARLADCRDIALLDYEKCLLENTRHAIRLEWGAIIGHVLQRNPPLNPYAHLSRYLTAEELCTVRHLPDRSQEQIDAIIACVDTQGACDAALRQRVYDWFRRSAGGWHNP